MILSKEIKYWVELAEYDLGTAKAMLYKPQKRIYMLKVIAGSNLH